ncbi:hypothetical protein M9Y10_038021 [Tritrichomonas musculus]|uniref:Protein kinase domain-containing protein n=1 Tax=Tritrichomonas musculus TaxID=1915356 RepID=A0ABR2K883_9EUKA
MSQNNQPQMHQEAGKKKKHGIITYPDQIGQYTIEKTIGEGAFSIVKLTNNELNNKKYACKIVPIHMLEERDLYQRFELEVRISQLMRHPGVAAITDILKDDNNFYIFMEYYPKGNLLNYIVSRHKLDEKEAKGLIYQIFDALEYVHRQKVSHRDLKPENIMIDDSGRLRISDFGLSRFVGDDNLVKTPCGSPCYVSPECISGKFYDGLISDVWSCGVILYAMVTGMLPWTKRKMSDLFNQIRNADFKIPTYVSNQCANLIQMLLTVDPNKRITLEQAKHHTWFDGKPSNDSISLKYLEQMKNNDYESVPYLSTRKVDIYFRPDIDFDADNQFRGIRNIHAINKSMNQKNVDVSSPLLQINEAVKLLGDDIKFRKRDDDSEDSSSKEPNNVNLSIVSSSGQLIISSKLVTKEETPNSILTGDERVIIEEEEDNKDNNRSQIRRRDTRMKKGHRNSAQFPRRFEPISYIF